MTSTLAIAAWRRAGSLVAALASVSTSLIGTAAAQGPAFDHAGLARQVLEQHIRPGYDRLATAAAGLAEQLRGHCAATAASARTVVAGFDNVVTAWGRIEHIEFGPITQGKRRERIFFWPDRRGLGARQVAQALASRDASVLDPASLADRSVALQGLGALEAVLFTDGDMPGAAADGRSHRCGFGAAIAANLAAITRQLADEWRDETGYAGHWLRPGEGNPAFLKPSETTLAIAKAFDQGLERARDERIAGPMGLNKQRKRMPAAFASSGRTLRLVIANVEGVRDLYEAGGLHAAVGRAAAGETNDLALADLVARELATAIAVMQPHSTVAKPFDDAKISQQLIPAGFPLKNARVLAGDLLVRIAGLTLGFNASDGD